MKHSDARIPDFQAPQLRSLYSSERRSVDAEQLASAELKFVQKNVYRSVIEGHSYYIKHFCEHRRRHQLQLKQGLKQHKAEQELATLKQLEKLGFSAIQPASVLLRTSPEGMQESILITEDYLAANPDTQLMSDYIAAHGPQTTLLLLEDTVNRLLQCGLIHLDIHTDNFLPTVSR
ncbi:lipopolysaccharide kinase InaA family protein [Aliamphritea spongicola]|nr:lipopolysaccharide kinase InaA family protein [Aliamphritea spongicola]